MEDKLLKIFFQPERWKNAIAKGYGKGIKEMVLREFVSPEGRVRLLGQMLAGEYKIQRPHTAKIPKEMAGEFRTVFVNEGADRIVLSIANDQLFEAMPEMVHPSCTSYQKGIGCSKIVSKASKMIEELSGSDHKVMGWKSDLSKYFDTVPIRFIDEAFDKVEAKWGHSLVVDVLRDYYHNDLYYDSELKKEVEHYQSLKQGCAVAAWLADVVLYHIDEKLSGLDGFYVRYSDDCLFIGPDYEKAMLILEEELGKMEMKLNPKKVEYLTNDRWFKFLGYSIKGRDISLSGTRIKTFVKEVKARSIDKIRGGQSFKKALHSVQNWLYYGDGSHSWATGVLKTINVPADINKLNGFVMDCLRAVMVGKSVGMDDIGGLGWVRESPTGCIARGKGSKVRTLRNKTGDKIDGYHSLGCMRNCLLYSRDLYDAVVRTI